MRERFTDREVMCLALTARAMLPAGEGLPGAELVDVAERLRTRSATWDPGVRARVRLLVRAWDLSPLLSPHRARFTSLAPGLQSAWIEQSYRSKAAWRRMILSALKQLVFLEWASTAEVEDALGYDYRCRRDNDPHGAGRVVPTEGRVMTIPVEPADYHRPGPAVAEGAVPSHLVSKRAFEIHDRTLVTYSWPELEDGAVVHADVAVVGSGAGGAVAAATLAEAGLDVIVLEEGGRVDSERDFVGPVFDRFQRFCRDNGTTQVLGTPPIPLPLGRVVGGTTVVNSGTCFRAPARVLARWSSEFGIEGADAHSLAPYYEDVEEFLNVRPVPWELLGPNGMAAHVGATALGYSGGQLLRNIADCHGCGQCAFGCPTDAKQAMHISYLPRASRAGARIYAHCRVRRIVLDEGRATGVAVDLLSPTDSARRGSMTVTADHVVVCAGAIHTPALLDASGVPDPSRQTGRNLRIHPATGVGGIFENIDKGWKGTLQSYYIDQFFDSHELMFEATTTVPGIGAGSIPGIGAPAMAGMASFDKLVTLGFYVSDTSSGRVVRVRNQVVPTYRLNALDTRRMGIGLAIAAEVLLAAGASKVYPGLPGLDSIGAREDIAQLRDGSIKPAHLKLTAFHPMGTARMGADPASSVVDPFGRHHAVRGLWVADSSTFPTCVGVNPQMTIMAFAKRAAEELARSHGGEVDRSLRGATA